MMRNAVLHTRRTLAVQLTSPAISSFSCPRSVAHIDGSDNLHSYEGGPGGGCAAAGAGLGWAKAADQMQRPWTAVQLLFGLSLRLCRGCVHYWLSTPSAGEVKLLAAGTCRSMTWPAATALGAPAAACLASPSRFSAGTRPMGFATNTGHEVAQRVLAADVNDVGPEVLQLVQGAEAQVREGFWCMSLPRGK